jgi:hypothetical protein
MRRKTMRLIDADAIPYTMLYKENWIEGTGREEKGVWKSDIDKLPTIEAEPKRGRWIEASTDGAVFCSECGTEWLSEAARYYNFCPNCGARMEASDD